MLIVLDSGPLGLLSNPAAARTSPDAHEWAIERVASGDQLCVPEIADYEVRRELIRANKVAGIERLDELCRGLVYAPLTTPIMRTAATLWAQARNAGRQTANNSALDGDVILAAQTIGLSDGRTVVVATTNAKHLERYVDARRWSDI